MKTIALAGNPNAGKSTLFNALTGAHQHVGNWPGKTVEKKEGRFRLNGQEIALVDLPGTYSLTAYSMEEIIARDFIIEGAPDAVVCVVDAANLERNLYLVLQIIEMNVPVILALNMCDVAEKRGIRIDAGKLSANLNGLPIICTIGSREIGIEALREAIGRASAHQVDLNLSYPSVMREALGKVQALIEADKGLSRYPSGWLALKLLEADQDLLKRVSGNLALTEAVQESIQHVLEETGEEPDTLIADARYTYIGELVKSAVKRPAVEAATASDQIDQVLTHRIWGVPIFLALMWVVFQLTANASAPMVDFVDTLINGVGAKWLAAITSALGLQGTWIEALLLQGILPGVGGVLVFVPVLAILYLAIAILEDTGYMARAAFVMDRLMSRIGLHGKSFLPLLVGFGCNVPAIYATRTLENPRDRKITAFITTFMSCGARLPIYVVFGTALFGAASGTIIFSMYLLGIGMAIFTSLLFTKVIYRNKPVPPFVMELPPYRLPQWRIVRRSVFERTASFVQKAATIILAVSVLVWLLLAIPADGKGEFNNVSAQASLFGAASSAIAPIFGPAGFGEWQASGALIAGVVAKEVVVSTMSQIYVSEAKVEDFVTAPTTFVEDIQGLVADFGTALVLTGQEIVNIVPRTLNILPFMRLPEANFTGASGEEDSATALQSALASTFTPLSALAFCIFTLLYVPCMTTVAAMRHEFGARWMIAQMVYALAVAWLAAVAVFQIGTWLGLGN